MVRSCHLDTCPVGIATQRPELRAKYAATPEQVETYLLFVAEEAREPACRARSALVRGGRRPDRPAAPAGTGDARADALDLAPLLDSPAGRYAGEPMPVAGGGELGERLAADAEPALDGAALVEPVYAISTWDRAVGARLGGADRPALRRASRLPAASAPASTGSAGQSFGAFLAAGVALDLVGEANDYVGKSMGGGRIAIRPPEGDARRSRAARQHRALRRDRRRALLRRPRRRALRRPELGRGRRRRGNRRPRLRVHDERDGRRPRRDRAATSAPG